MSIDLSLATEERVTFGPFELLPAERLLAREGVPVPIGGRAMDILVLLVDHEGEIVSQRDLFASVWPGINVEASSLRFHVAALRRALGDGQDGTQYITNVPGRGYSFVAPTSRRPHSLARAAAASPASAFALPPMLDRIVGREEAVAEVADLLGRERFVSIVGPGGIGKTTVSLAVAHASLDAFDGAVCFVDFGLLNPTDPVAGAVAAALKLPTTSVDATPQVLDLLAASRLLLVCDSCEHVIDGLAALAEAIYTTAPQTHVLATSREPLRAAGENVYRLAALECPPDDATLTMERLMAFSAAQLFVDRVQAAGGPSMFSDADAPVIAQICSKLDGMALALELAAGRVEAYGLRQTASLLDHRLRLSWRGRRTALARHQTLNATLDWSYTILSDLEQIVLRCLSVFVSPFTLDGVQAVLDRPDITSAAVSAAMAGLAAKSLVTTLVSEGAVRYRLLDTTRFYTAAKLEQSGERNLVAHRHADYVLGQTIQMSKALTRLTARPVKSPFPEILSDVREGLTWCFSEDGDCELGARLAAAAAPMMLDLSLLQECRTWCEQGLAANASIRLEGSVEMLLQSSLGLALLFLGSEDGMMEKRLRRALELAGEGGDAASELRFLSALHIFYHRAGAYNEMLDLARRGEATAARLGEPGGQAAADAMLSVAHHLKGEPRISERFAQRALLRFSASHHWPLLLLGLDHRVRALVAVARNQWVLGHTERAIGAALHALDEAARAEHPVTLAAVIGCTIQVFLWVGDLATAEALSNQLEDLAVNNGLEPYRQIAVGLRGCQYVRRGQAEAGVMLIETALAQLHRLGYRMNTVEFMIDRAAGLAATERTPEALEVIDEALAAIRAQGEDFLLPEALRLRGEVLAELGEGAPEPPGPDFVRAVELARAQGAPAWALRATVSLARHLVRCDRSQEALAPLEHAISEVDTDAETSDLRAAVALYGQLRDARTRF